MRIENALIVDDNQKFLDELEKQLNFFGIINITKVNNLKDAICKIDDNYYQFCIFDMDIDNKEDGLLLTKKASNKNFFNVLLTNNDREDILLKKKEFGFHFYYEKNGDKKLVQEIINQYDSYTNHNSFDQKFDKTYLIDDKLSKVLKQSICSPENSPILIQGPTGVGKTKLAKAISYFFNKESNFANINLREENPETLRSLLFGHKKGAFTGANTDRPGLFESFDGGIIYLDEIDSLPLEDQVLLLKVIEERVFTPVGSSESKQANYLRLVISSKIPLEKLVKKGLFRDDLYNRINNNIINLLPLSNRLDNLSLIITNYIKSKISYKIAIDDSAIEIIKSSNLDGNFRDLDQICSKIKIQGIQYITTEVAENLIRPLVTIKSENSIDINSVVNLSLEIGLEDALHIVKNKVIKEVSESKTQSETAVLLKVSKSTVSRALQKS